MLFYIYSIAQKKRSVKQIMQDEKYFLGLDIGTDSCGWAVTDENYNLLRAKGKDLWGVRLFEQAEVASDRRLKRATRRRNERRKLKMAWLNEIFEKEIEKVDADFLQRIKYSSLFQDDKQRLDSNLITKYSLFSDYKDGQLIYSDCDYYKEYKTIFHLRNYLLTNPAKDIRHLYLAVHSLIKHRGHFLFEGNFSQNGNVVDLLNDLVGYAEELSSYELIDKDFALTLPKTDLEILDIIKNNGLKDSKTKIKELLSAKTPSAKTVAECLCNGVMALKNLYNLDEEIKLDFNDEDFNIDTALNEKGISLTEEQIIFIEKVKNIYSVLQLKKILSNHTYLSQSMVETYEQHKSDLKIFKAFIKTYYKSCYYDMFRNSNVSFTNYCLYVNVDKYGNKKRVLGLDYSNRKQEEFYKHIKSILAKPVELENYNEEEYNRIKNDILDKIEHNIFLPKQRTNNNSVLPYQIILNELKQILKVSAEKYKFLNEIDQTGLSNIEKIEKILTFRVPYFVGPITDKDNSKYSWAEKISNLELKPWTLDKIIDLDKAEDDFISRMINKCTYLKTQDVLPFNSIIYSKFKLLNELNKLCINGQNISVDLKQDIFENLFKTNGKVSANMLKKYLVNIGKYKNTSEIDLTGIDKDFKNNFNSYAKLIKFVDKDFVDKNIEIFEKVILYHTIITDKTRLEKRLKKEFANIFNDEQIKYLKSLNFSKWGNLSREFLTMQFADKETGEITSIIQELWQTNQNLQEILYNPKYELIEQLDNLTQEVKDEIVYSDVEELYCSPAVKRGVWQSIQIIKEIIKVKKKLPTKIFIEVTRHDEEKGDKGRKLSRKTNLEAIYNSKEFKNMVSQTDIDIAELLDKLNKKDDTSLRSEKLYLYFLQLGKCAYSGDRIDINDLYLDNVYDVDHILPQSKLKDDSIDNKVLVKRTYNERKGDNYPIFSYHPDWVNNRKDFWKLLLDLKLMSAKKYKNLTRVDDLTDDELSSFIERQLVETNQSAKCVIDLLKKIMPNQRDIILSKAHIVSEFRNKYNIYKSRSINDLHHAKDAYLNIVVGNVIYNRFTNNPRNFYKTKNKNSNTTVNYKKIFDNIIYSFSTGEVVWNGDKNESNNKSLIQVKKIATKNSCLVTRMPYMKYNGAFYDETVYKSKLHNPKTSASFALKGENNPLSNIERYGGYNKLSIAFFMLIQSEDKKGNIIKTIEPISVFKYRKYHTKQNYIELIFNDIVAENNLKNAKIIIPIIKFKSKFKIAKGYFLLGGKTGGKLFLHNANQFYVSNQDTGYIKAIEKLIEINTQHKLDSIKKINKTEDFNNLEKLIISPKSKEKNTEIYLTKEKNLYLYNLFVSKLKTDIYYSQLSSMVNKLVDKTEAFKQLNIFEQAVVLNQILKRISTGAGTSDLSLLGEGGSLGAMTISQNITGKGISLIFESVTGLFSKEIKL